MSKPRKRIDPNQPSLFDLIRQEQESIVSKTDQGRLNVQGELRECITDCIRACNLSRWEVAGRMSSLMDQEVTIHQLNAWTAESKDGHRFPAEYLPAFCQAVECFEPLKLLAARAGVFVVQGPDALRAEIQKLDEQIKTLQDQKRTRLLFIRGMNEKA